jgi:hypothetical protein
VILALVEFRTTIQGSIFSLSVDFLFVFCGFFGSNIGLLNLTAPSADPLAWTSYSLQSEGVNEAEAQPRSKK